MSARRIPLRRRESGVTLVELLIATFLVALILLAIAPLFITSVKANYSANEYTSIHNIARDKLEQLMSLPFNDTQLKRDVTGTKAANGAIAEPDLDVALQRDHVLTAGRVVPIVKVPWFGRAEHHAFRGV